MVQIAINAIEQQTVWETYRCLECRMYSGVIIDRRANISRHFNTKSIVKNS